MKKSVYYFFAVWLLLFTFKVQALPLFSESPDAVLTFISGHSAPVYLSLFFLLGVLLAATPCVLPMVPVLSGIIVGQKEKPSVGRAFRLSLSYVAGMALTYALAGMLAGYLGSTVQTWMQRPIVIISFSFVFVLMAFSMFGFFELKMPQFLSRAIQSKFGQGKSGYISAALMGILSTLIVSPCVTAPLIGVLAYIGQEGEVFKGGAILFVMALGMGLPLLITGAGLSAFLPKSGGWMMQVKSFFGFLMLAIAVWMAARIIPAQITQILWLTLLLSAAIFLLRNNQHSLFSKMLGYLLCFSAIALSLSYYLSKGINSLDNRANQVFVMIKDSADLKQRLSEAKNAHQKVFVEFFASWCGDCQAMDKTVFNQDAVASEMKNFVSLRVDISKKTEAVDEIKRRYGILGYPTLLFFDNDGNQRKELTAAGFLPKEKMLQLLKEAKA